jgi:hypothetical protein
VRVSRARRLLALAALGLLVASVVVAATSAEAAPAPRIMVSGDGETWEARLDSSLFGRDLLLVPGSRAVGTFWVKNVASDAAVLDARLVDVRVSSPAFASHLSVSASSPLAPTSDATRPVPVSTGACGALLEPVPLSAGQEAAITVDVLLASTAAAGTAGQSVAFGVLVTLRDDSAGLSPGVALDRCPDVGDAVDGVQTVVGGLGADPVAARAGAADAEAPEPVSTDVDGSSSDGRPTSGLRDTGTSPGEGADADAASEEAARFVVVALRAEWLPLVVAVVALLVGAFVAVDRHRPARRPEVDPGPEDGPEPGPAPGAGGRA